MCSPPYQRDLVSIINKHMAYIICDEETIMTLVLDLSEEESERLHALAEAQGTDEATVLRGLIPVVKSHGEEVASHVGSSQDIAEVVEEEGILVLTGHNV